MTEYERLLDDANNDNVTVIEDYSFKSDRIKGLYCDRIVALNKDLETETEKTCVLAEELGHHYTAVGNILDQSSIASRKQEMRGRLVAYNRLVGLRGIVDAYLHHCQNLFETAEYLGVTEEFLNDCIAYYKRKYGICAQIDNYIIMFEPGIAVLELV